jgi:hypothetical protein
MAEASHWQALVIVLTAREPQSQPGVGHGLLAGTHFDR